MNQFLNTLGEELYKSLCFRSNPINYLYLSMYMYVVLNYEVNMFKLNTRFLQRNIISNGENKNFIHHDKMSMEYIPPYTPLLYSKTGVCRDISSFLIFAPKDKKQNIDCR